MIAPPVTLHTVGGCNRQQPRQGRGCRHRTTAEFITMLPYATFAVAEGTSRVTVAGTANIQAAGDLILRGNHPSC